MSTVSSNAIFASAGTGKTHRLSNRYIELLAREVPTERILAVTFTRKAAGEILDRILDRLSEAALDAEKSRALGEAIGMGNPGSRHFAAILGRLSRSLNRAAVGTIDSFFGRLAASFAVDLDLPADWRIVSDDENQELHRRAIERVVEEPRFNVLGLVRSLSERPLASGVLSAMLEITGEVYAIGQSTRPEAWEAIGIPERYRRLDLVTLKAALDSLRRVQAPRKKDGEPHAAWMKAIKKAVEALESGDHEGFLECGLAKAMLPEPHTYQRIEPPREIIAALEPFIAHAGHVVLTGLIERTLAGRQLAGEFTRTYHELKQEEGAFQFEDVPRLLLEGGATKEPERMYYRLDAKIDHILLDEFQDTSIVQFRLLEPMIDEILSGGEGALDRSKSRSAAEAGRSLLCVGDVKQSLYQWRSAEPELLPAIPRRWPQVEPVVLHENRRSSPVVLEAVNTVFEGLGNNAVFVGSDKPDDLEAARAWAEQFPRHEAIKAFAGFVRLNVTPAGTDRVPVELAAMKAAAARIAEITRAGPGLSVGVLLPRKKHIPRLIHEMKQLGVEASEETGSPLTDAAPVAAALSMLHLADHPHDSAARFHIATSPLGKIVGLTSWKGRGAGARAASILRRRLAEEGLSKTLSGWLDSLTPSCDARERERFSQLVELSRLFEQSVGEAPLRMEPFVEYVKSKRVEAAGGARVRVMTIHASKGLEFDAVVLPELDVDLVNRKSPAFLVTRPDPLLDEAAVSRWAKDEVRQLHPQLEQNFQRHRRRELGKAFCVLYVAMTRARRCLEMFIHPPAKPESFRATHAGLLRAALEPGAGAEPGSIILASGDPDWASKREEHHDVETTVEDGPPIPEMSLRPRRPRSARHLQTASPSALAHSGWGPSVQASAPSLVETSIPLFRGTLFHAWLEQIEWLDTTPLESLDDGFLREVLLRAAPECLPEFAVHAAEFRRMLRAPDVAHILSRAAYRTGEMTTFRARRELEIALRDRPPEIGSEVLLLGRIDRIVTGETDGRITSADIIDYKTDAAMGTAESIAMLVDRYRPQMKAYGRAVGRLFGLDERAVTGKLVLLSIGKVVAV
jgi:ATP-dependent exoDNAse (exonuclease V) beta subunit